MVTQVYYANEYGDVIMFSKSKMELTQLVIDTENSNIESIRKATIKAFETPRNNLLQELIRNNFTWENAANKTFKAYKQLLN